MTGLKYFERTMFVIELIKKRKTGSPKELSRKLNVTERTVYNILESVRLAHPNPIVYSAEEKSYVFLNKKKSH